MNTCERFKKISKTFSILQIHVVYLQMGPVFIFIVGTDWLLQPLVSNKKMANWVRDGKRFFNAKAQYCCPLKYIQEKVPNL